jgi:hypothetical protein
VRRSRPEDIVDLIRRDHATVRAALQSVATAGGEDERWAASGMVADLLIRHEVA